jgi:hypothetical protein
MPDIARIQKNENISSTIGCCDICKSTSNDGEWYKFYFGRVLSVLEGSKFTSRQGNQIVTTTNYTINYEIAGNKSVYFCDNCIMLGDVKERKRITSILLILGIFVSLFLAAMVFIASLDPTYKSDTSIIPTFMILSILGIMFSVIWIITYIHYSKKIKSINENTSNEDIRKHRLDNEKGDRKAIEIYKNEFESKGLPRLFTRLEYSRLIIKK